MWWMDRDYENGTFIPGAADYAPRWAEAAREWREVEAAVGRARLNQPYGDGAREQFDLFYPAGQPKGLFVFVHGGYWMAFDRSSWSHFTRGATEAGWGRGGAELYAGARGANISDDRSDRGGCGSGGGAGAGGRLCWPGIRQAAIWWRGMSSAAGPLNADVAGRLRRVMPISPLSDLRPFLGLSNE